MIFNIHNSFLYYKDNYNIINDYYQNSVNIIKNILINNKDISINIIFGNENHKFNNNNKMIRINLNYEHTLVKQGGRDTNNAPLGKVMDNNVNYLVRIDRYNELNNADIIIDYSMPNIYNVKTSKLFDTFSQKHIYIYSSIYESYFITENRNLVTLTTFININEPRRLSLLNQIKQKSITHINVNNCFEKDKLQSLYKNTKILINIHQTDHHHTFEELRVLPALQCGVLVICENSPLSNLIPYNDYIIWTSYNTILDKVNEVINNYDYYFNLIFKNEKNKEKNKINLDELNTINYNILNNEINKYI